MTLFMYLGNQKTETYYIQTVFTSFIDYYKNQLMSHFPFTLLKCNSGYVLDYV